MSQPRARAGRKPAQSRPEGGAKPARGGAAGRPAAPAKPLPDPPASVRNAVRVMYAGVAVTAASMIAAVMGANSLRAAMQRANPTLPPATVTKLAGSAVTFEVLAGLVFLVAWIGMIWASRKGYPWVRGMAGVLLVFNTLMGALSLTQGIGAGSLLSVLIWLVGLASTVLLWRKDAAQFFTTARAR